MEILVLLIPISVVFIAVAIWAFIWATNHGQFDQLDENALNIFDAEDEVEELSMNKDQISNRGRSK